MVGVLELNTRKEKDPVVSMSDKEIIVASLKRVERRIRTNRLFSELSLGAVLFLAIPLLLKLWDLIEPLRGVTISLAVGIWVLLFASFVIWRGIQDYVSSPRIMGSTLELHPLIVLFGVLAGGEVAGVIGVFLSIPVLATLRILWHTWMLYRRSA